MTTKSPNDLLRHAYEIRLEIPGHLRFYCIRKIDDSAWGIFDVNDCYYLTKKGEWDSDVTNTEPDTFKTLDACMKAIEKVKPLTVEKAIKEFEAFILSEDEDDQKGLREVLALFQAGHYKSAATRARKLDTFVREGIPAIVWYYMDKVE